MKATSAGTIIGKALENYTSSDPNAIGKIMVFVNISWADPTVTIKDKGCDKAHFTIGADYEKLLRLARSELSPWRRCGK